MSDERKPNLTLDTPPGKLNRGAASESRVWLPLLLVLQIVLVVFMALLLSRSGQHADRISGNGSSAQELRDLALELENKSLVGEAARGWEAYLAAAPGITVDSQGISLRQYPSLQA